MKTDIDRLHQVVDSRGTWAYHDARQLGKSFSKCHDVAGMVSLELFTVIVVITTYSNDVEYIFPMMMDVFNDHQLELTQVDRSTLKCNNTLIKFFRESDRYKVDLYGACGVVEIGHNN